MVPSAKRIRNGVVYLVMASAMLTSVGSVMAAGTFLEGDVTLIRTFSTLGPSFGWAVADLQDISNPPDGVTDIIIPALGLSRVIVYSGADGAVLHTLLKPGTDGNGSFGNAVADAGDVNGDSVHDIVVGSPGQTTIGTNPGRAYVFSGTDGSLIHTLVGEASRDSFGSGVGGAGDVNGDGRADILVGASTNDASGTDSGRAYIYSGLDGSLIRTLNAEASGDGFGAGTSGTGDVSGDGIPDQIVGAPGGGTFGRAYVFSGADGTLHFMTNSPAGGSQYGVFFVAGPGDVNNDGRRDVYVGDYAAQSGRGNAFVYSGIDGSLIHSFPGNPGAGVGPGRGAGDVDSDGFADLLVGHWTVSQGASNAGRAVLYSGATGLPLRTITSTTANENFGFDAVGVGDTNGDGFIDLLVSASSQSRVYLIAGTNLVPQTDPPAADPTGISKTRFLSFAPANSGDQTALRVSMTSLHHVNPPYSGGPSVPFTGFEGQVRWVGPPSQYTESTSSGTPFYASVLQCTPHYQDWSTIPLLHVTGSAVVPSSSYHVAHLGAACAGAEDNCDDVSDPLEILTTRWGDVDELYNPPSPTVQPDVADISSMVNKFRSAPGAPIKARALLAGDAFGNVNLSQDLSFSHISACVDAFRGLPYPFTIEACP